MPISRDNSAESVPEADREGDGVRVAFYARVSTTDKGQNVETQLHALRQAAAQRGWTVVGEWCDEASATDLRGRRSWRDLKDKCKRGGVDAIAVLRLDRAFRSVKMMHDDLALLDKYGVKFVSITQDFDTTTPMGKFILTLLALLAELERDMISVRVHEGIDRAKAQGKKLGRPKGATDKKKRQIHGYKDRWGNEASRRRDIRKDTKPE
jgi:DNA invertase Pin-like site-specific DNA recombinase